MKKVIFYENERLDIPDAHAIQDLVYDYMAHFMGAVIGSVQGITKVLKLDYTAYAASNVIEIVGKTYIVKTHDGGTFDYSDEAGGEFKAQTEAGAPAAYCVWFDSEIDPAKIDLTYIKPQADQAVADIEHYWTKYSIWARRIEKKVDDDSRRFWSGPAQNEVTTVVATRSDSSVEWVVDKRYQAGSAGNPGKKSTEGWVRVFDCIGTVQPGGDTAVASPDGSYISGFGPSGADAPIFRPVMLWDYNRQRDGYTDLASAEGLKTPETMQQFKSRTPLSGMREDTSGGIDPNVGHLSYGQPYPNPPHIGSLNRVSAYPTMSGSGGDSRVNTLAYDMLLQTECAHSPDHWGTNPNLGIGGIISKLCDAVASMRNGFPRDPFAFRRIDQTYAEHTRKVDDDGDNVIDQTFTVAADTLPDLTSVRPLSHLNQFYANWGRAHPHVILSGMIANRINSDTGDTLHWYGPLWNPLGFILHQALGDNGRNAYKVYPRFAPTFIGENGWAVNKPQPNFDICIEAPDGMDNELFIFSAHSQKVVSWAPHDGHPFGRPWQHQGYYQGLVHIGPGEGGDLTDGAGKLNNIFLEGNQYGDEGGHTHWTSVVVYGVAPNIYHADSVFRGQPNSLYTDKLLNSNVWQTEYAFGGSEGVAGRASGANSSTGYGPDCAGLSIANAGGGLGVSNSHLTKYAIDQGTGIPDPSGAFEDGWWQYPNVSSQDK